MSLSQLYVENTLTILLKTVEISAPTETGFPLSLYRVKRQKAEPAGNGLNVTIDFPESDKPRERKCPLLFR